METGTTIFKNLLNEIERKLEHMGIPNSPSNLYDPIRYTLKNGGKRSRPLLTLLGAGIFSNNTTKALDAAISVEIFHNFTLIHDDIMDDAPFRRGQDSVVKKWNRDVAILSGDALMILAWKQLNTYEPEISKRLITVLNETALEVCEGQQMDMDFESDDSITLVDYVEMIRKKTAVLLGASLKMGVIISGASELSFLNYG